MNRTEFEALRDLPGKTIRDDIRFVERRATKPLLVAEDLRIHNDHDVDARMSITYNPAVRSVSINVHVPGLGPICRLDSNGPRHRPCGRDHKHALVTEECPRRNLADGVTDRPELARKSTRELFAWYCTVARIDHEGVFVAPDE